MDLQSAILESETLRGFYGQSEQIFRLWNWIFELVTHWHRTADPSHLLPAGDCPVTQTVTSQPGVHHKYRLQGTYTLSTGSRVHTDSPPLWNCLDLRVWCTRWHASVSHTGQLELTPSLLAHCSICEGLRTENWTGNTQLSASNDNKLQSRQD